MLYRDYSLSYEDAGGFTWRYIRDNSHDLTTAKDLCHSSAGKDDIVPVLLQSWLSDPNFYGLVAEFNGQLV